MWLDSPNAPHCEKPYTYNKTSSKMYYVIIIVALRKLFLRQTGDCSSNHLVTTGLGTEQLEETLKTLFPHYSVAQIDRDSTSRKGKLEGYLEDIQQPKAKF